MKELLEAWSRSNPLSGSRQHHRSIGASAAKPALATTVKAKLRGWLRQEQRLWLTAIGIATGVIALRCFELLQSVELATLDQLFRLRPQPSSDERIVIVEIDDEDIEWLKTWPIPDRQLAILLQKIRSQQPRVIGLDIYRDLRVGEGYEELEQIFQTTPNLIGIELLMKVSHEGVPAPPALAAQNQVGFNNVVVDADGVMRRALLFQRIDQQMHRSFALQVASYYLGPQGIELRRIQGQQMRLGAADLRPLQKNDGGYVNLDTGGYQILANPSQVPFERVSLEDVMEGKISPQLFRDRIVLIGSTAESLRDFFNTPYSGGLIGKSARDEKPAAVAADSDSDSSAGNLRRVSGVELQGYIVSQLLDAALGQRPLMQVWTDPIEWFWIFCWSWVGAALCWKIRSPGRSAMGVVLLGAALVVICYMSLLEGWWIPLAPPLLAMSGSAMWVIGHLAYLEEELKKSKEFLNSIINTIPDPVFVKDQQHRWIVLNEAYCRLISFNAEGLLGQSDDDVFDQEQAKRFWQQDELTFQSGLAYETEDELTNALGITYLVATKRSLHRDAAGNLFLVGVIRDITQQKQREETLKRAAEELGRSNAELRQAKDVLTRMAYYDTLTGLPNRKLFHERLQEALVWGKEHNQLVALLFLDLDGFKQINDTHGHQAGDMLLQAAAQRLMGCLRGSDTVARLGGDEFVAILPGIPSMQDVSRVADKILTTLAQSFVLQGIRMSISTSIGISVSPTDGDGMDNLVIKADAAMYRAKRLGKNRYEFFQTIATAEALEAEYADP